jgi:hypothetical protein
VDQEIPPATASRPRRARLRATPTPWAGLPSLPDDAEAREAAHDLTLEVGQ